MAAVCSGIKQQSAISLTNLLWLTQTDSELGTVGKAENIPFLKVSTSLILINYWYWPFTQKLYCKYSNENSCCKLVQSNIISPAASVPPVQCIEAQPCSQGYRAERVEKLR